MRRHLLVAALLLPLVAAVFSPRASAGTLLALDLPALVEQSEYVVVANAQRESSRYAGGTIVTDVTLKVISGLKGTPKAGDLLTVTHLGGEVDQVALKVPGAAHFKLGQSAVVFLRRSQASDGWNVTGMGQGVLPITGRGDGAQVLPAENTGTLMQRDGEGKLVEQHTAAAPPRPLADLLAEIERLLKK